jgi:2-dehydro-3-deoxy-D-arabinonate dehydratase
MEIIRFLPGGSAAPRVGVAEGDTVTELAAGSLAELLAEPLTGIRRQCEEAAGAVHARAGVQLLAPIDGRTEVWAAGVTYELSQRERMKESVGAAAFYQQVYDADRPELFFKSVAWRVAGPGQPIAVRADSAIDVPEPELALVLNSQGEVCGYTICNDVSSRTIEGENPLYLPQAKIYLGACALGPAIRPAWEVPHPYALAIQLTIAQAGAAIWHGTASTASLHRALGELAEYLYRAEVFPDGAVLSTGTCLVPELPFTLTDGDLVTIGIEQLGALSNPVVRGRLDWPLPPPT